MSAYGKDLTADALLGLEAALNSVNARPGAGADFVFRPGVPSSGNAYGTEEELLAATADIDAPTVLCDFAAVGGGYAITRDWTFATALTIGATVPVTGAFSLTVPEPFKITTGVAFGVRSGMQVLLDRASTPGIVQVSPFGLKLIASVEGAVLDNIGTFEGLEATPVGVFQVFSVSNGGSVRITGGQPMLDVQGGGVIGVNFLSSRLINQGYQDNWVSGSAASTLAFVAVDASFQLPALPGFAGTLLPTGYIDLAESTVYTPAVPANWVAPVPTKVSEALDRLAAALGPIP